MLAYRGKERIELVEIDVQCGCILKTKYNTCNELRTSFGT